MQGHRMWNSSGPGFFLHTVCLHLCRPSIIVGMLYHAYVSANEQVEKPLQWSSDLEGLWRLRRPADTSTVTETGEGDEWKRKQEKRAVSRKDCFSCVNFFFCVCVLLECLRRNSPLRSLLGLPGVSLFLFCRKYITAQTVKGGSCFNLKTERTIPACGHLWKCSSTFCHIHSLVLFVTFNFHIH